NEDHQQQAQSPYSASKIAADKLVESYHRSFSLPATIIRPFNTFGPRQSCRAIIPSIIGQAAYGGAVKVGSLSPVRDFCYVADTVAGFIAVTSAEGAVGKVVTSEPAEASRSRRWPRPFSSLWEAMRN